MKKKVLIILLLLIFLSINVSAKETWSGYINNWSKSSLNLNSYDRVLWEKGYGIWLKDQKPVFGSSKKEKTLSFTLNETSSLDFEILSSERKRPELLIQLEHYNNGKYILMFSDDYRSKASYKGERKNIKYLNKKGKVKKFAVMPKGKYRIKLKSRATNYSMNYGGIAVRIGVKNIGDTTKIIRKNQNFYQRATGGYYSRSYGSYSLNYTNKTGKKIQIANSKYNIEDYDRTYRSYNGKKYNYSPELNYNSMGININNGGVRYKIAIEAGDVGVYKNKKLLKKYNNKYYYKKLLKGSIRSKSATYGSRSGSTKGYHYKYNIKKIFDDFPEILTVDNNKNIKIELPRILSTYVSRNKPKRKKSRYTYAPHPYSNGNFYTKIAVTPKPTFGLDRIIFKENEYGTYQLAAMSEAGNYPLSFQRVGSSSDGIKVYSDGRVVLDLRNKYNLNKETDNKLSYYKKIKIRITDSKGNKEEKYVRVYIENEPYRISQPSYLSYPPIPNKPSNLSYNAPALNSFHPLPKPLQLKNYPLKNISDKLSSPGLSPNTANNNIRTLLYNAQINDYKSIESADDYVATTKKLEEFKRAYGMWKKVQDYYEEREKSDDPYEFDKNYKIAEKEYDEIREILQTRIEDINYNQYLYDRYRCQTNDYNSKTQQKINNYVNYYNTSYTNDFNKWVNDKNNYFNDLDSIKKEIERRYSTNMSRKSSKLREIDRAVNKYGLVSLQKSQVKSVPSPGNYNNTIADTKNSFDNNDKAELNYGFKNIFNIGERQSLKNSSNPKDYIYNLLKEDLKIPAEIQGDKKFKVNDELKPLNCSLGYKEYEDKSYNARTDGINRGVIRWEKDRYQKIY